MSNSPCLHAERIRRASSTATSWEWSRSPNLLNLPSGVGAGSKAAKSKIHLGIEKEFRPAKKAHPALRCHDYAALVERLHEAGVDILEADDIPGARRCHIYDPFGNRIELVGT